MAREFELKYRATPEKIQAIREKFGDFTTVSMETDYYDTPDRAISLRRWTLRRRLENGRSVCTLKIPLPDGSRGEWEAECGTIAGAPEILCKLGAPTELTDLVGKGLVTACGARFTRLAAVVRESACTVELALDAGCLLGGGRTLPLCEVEVELKSGSEAAAVAFARSLAEEFGLEPEPKSKVARALALAADR